MSWTDPLRVFQLSTLSIKRCNDRENDKICRKNQGQIQRGGGYAPRALRGYREGAVGRYPPPILILRFNLSTLALLRFFEIAGWKWAGNKSSRKLSDSFQNILKACWKYIKIHRKYLRVQLEFKNIIVPQKVILKNLAPP